MSPKHEPKAAARLSPTLVPAVHSRAAAAPGCVWGYDDTTIWWWQLSWWWRWQCGDSGFQSNLKNQLPCRQELRQLLGWRWWSLWWWWWWWCWWWWGQWWWWWRWWSVKQFGKWTADLKYRHRRFCCWGRPQRLLKDHNEEFSDVSICMSAWRFIRKHHYVIQKQIHL